MEQVILDSLVLYLHTQYRNEIWGLHNEETSLDKRQRHAAYRHWILLEYGRLGMGRREVIPSCCVWKIRDRYPSANNLYRGFSTGRLG